VVGDHRRLHPYGASHVPLLGEVSEWARSQRSGAVMAELICPSGNVDYNANWPSNVGAGTFVQGAFCAPGWTGAIGRQCQLNGQWAISATGGCTRTRICGASYPGGSGEWDDNPDANA
jgi:hypothetical protein